MNARCLKILEPEHVNVPLVLLAFKYIVIENNYVVQVKAMRNIDEPMHIKTTHGVLS